MNRAVSKINRTSVAQRGCVHRRIVQELSFCGGPNQGMCCSSALLVWERRQLLSAGGADEGVTIFPPPLLSISWIFHTSSSPPFRGRFWIYLASFPSHLSLLNCFEAHSVDEDAMHEALCPTDFAHEESKQEAQQLGTTPFPSHHGKRATLAHGRGDVDLLCECRIKERVEECSG